MAAGSFLRPMTAVAWGVDLPDDTVLSTNATVGLEENEGTIGFDELILSNHVSPPPLLFNSFSLRFCKRFSSFCFSTKILDYIKGCMKEALLKRFAMHGL